MNLIYIDLIYDYMDAFAYKVKRVSEKLGINPNWLMGVMYFETAGTFDPAIQNKYTNATGLIQFMPSTAKSLGTSVDELAEMANFEQLEYVYQYLKPYRGKMRSFIDVYLAVFFPAAMNKDADFVLQAGSLSASKIASQNPGFDIDKDSKVTVYEIETKLLSVFDPAVREELKKKTIHS